MLDLLASAGVTRRDNPYQTSGGVPQHAASRAADKDNLVRQADWLMTLDADEYLNIHAGHGRLSDLFLMPFPKPGRSPCRGGSLGMPMPIALWTDLLPSNFICAHQNLRRASSRPGHSRYSSATSERSNFWACTGPRGLARQRPRRLSRSMAPGVHFPLSCGVVGGV